MSDMCRTTFTVIIFLPTSKSSSISHFCNNSSYTIVHNFVLQACEDGHEVNRWSSSPMLPNGVYSANLQAVSSVVVSGNNFAKIALFAKFLGLAFPGSSSFYRIQNKCVVPVVDRYWANMRDSALEEHRAVNVVVSGIEILLLK